MSVRRRVTRRDFVRTTGLAITGSAVGFPGIGCGAQQIREFLPGLYPAATATPTDAASLGCQAVNPAPTATMQYLVASQIGCALDVDLTTGRNKHTGGEATDDGPRINAALYAATQDNPLTLLLDGTALISGLFLPAGGYWSIVGLGCNAGFFVKSGINNDGIHNGGPRAAVPSDPGPKAPLAARGSSVLLSNFTLNGNQGNGHNGDSTSGAAQGISSRDLWYFGINLMNLDNITITNVTVINAPSYHFRLSNVGHVAVAGCVMKSTGPNTDGLHFDGPANDITISNCDFTCGDDAIALNCPEGFTGDISRVAVSHCTFNSLSLMRLYTGNPGSPSFKIDEVTVTDCTGTMTTAAFLVGEFPVADPNAVLSLVCTNCQVSAPVVLNITTDFSTISLNDVTITTPAGSGFGLARSLYGNGHPYAGASLSYQNCVVQRQSVDGVSALILNSGSRIATLECNGYRVQDPPGSSFPPCPELVVPTQGSVGQLILDSVNAANITAPVLPNEFSSIGSISGMGVLATGWALPDSVMANGVPYLSASTHQPSIKVAGVVTHYP